jgi:phage shock protein PspC (stress-responsive transcriptional regulator)
MDQTIGQDRAIRRLYRSRQERLLLGLSGGLARYMEVDPTVVRLGWVVATLATGPGALVAYLILAAIVPNEPLDAPII